MSVPAQGPKLRNSCDACNLAKLKCSQARPTCARCENQGIRCVYGVSLRSGKNRATKTNIQKPSPDVARSRQDSAVASDFMQTPSAPSTDSNALFDPSYDSMTEATLPLPEDWSIFLGDTSNAFLTNDSSPMELDSNNSYTHVRLPRHSSTPNVPSFPSDLSLDVTQTAPQDFTAATSHPSSTSSRGQSTSSHNFSFDVHLPPSVLGTAGCPCYTKLLQQLLALNNVSGTQAAADAVLNQNKQVISICQSLLHHQRNHRHDISFAFTFAALVTKIIAIYEAVYRPQYYQNGSATTTASSASMRYLSNQKLLCDADMSRDVSPDRGGQSGTTKSPTSHSRATSRSKPASPFRLTLGNYQLEEIDEERLKMDMFRIELSRVSALVKALKQHLCDQGLNDHDHLSNYERKAGEDIIYYLQKKLKVSAEMSRE